VLANEAPGLGARVTVADAASQEERGVLRLHLARHGEVEGAGHLLGGGEVRQRVEVPQLLLRRAGGPEPIHVAGLVGIRAHRRHHAHRGGGQLGGHRRRVGVGPLEQRAGPLLGVRVVAENGQCANQRTAQLAGDGRLAGRRLPAHASQCRSDEVTDEGAEVLSRFALQEAAAPPEAGQENLPDLQPVLSAEPGGEPAEVVGSE
jgi:hypothetical protein